MNHVKTLLFAALLTLPTAFAGAADGPMETIRYADLDISRTEGAHVLYRRIEAAAHRVCQLPITSDWRAARIEQACIDRSIADAVQSVHSSALTAQLRVTHTTRLARN